MNPTDIRNKTFSKAMSGYKIEEVTGYLEEVAAYVEQLLDEINTSEENMFKLAEEIKKYNKEKTALTNAIVRAERMVEEVTVEADKQAEEILAKATEKANLMTIEARKKIEKESKMLMNLQNNVAGFREKIVRMYQGQIDLINKLPDDDFSGVLETVKEKYSSNLDNIENNTDVKDVLDSQNEQLKLKEQEPEPEDEVIIEKTAKNERVLKEKRLRTGGLDNFFGESNPIERK